MCEPILVIDDAWEIQSTLRELLEDERCEIDMAGDSSPVWEKLDRHPGSYEVILLDQMSPKMDRTQAIQTLQRQEEASSYLTIVICTNHDTVRQAAEMKVHRGRAKPFGLQTLFMLFSFFRSCAFRTGI